MKILKQFNCIKRKKKYVKIVYGDGKVLNDLPTSKIREKKGWYFIETEKSLLQINKIHIQEITYYKK